VTDVLLSERRDGAVLLTLNRPDKRNALNGALVEALHAAFDKFADQVAYITAGLPERTWEFEDFRPETDKWLNKMFRAINRLESDHGGIFDW